VAFDERLFRQESGRLVTALSRIFGLHNLALAEDVAQDVFCRAFEVWKQRGVPENPSAWLLRAAKNRAIDVLRRERTARKFAPELGRLIESEWTLVPSVNEYFKPEAIEDDQLRMMFSCCDPGISEESQIALILHLLCGFTAAEIASAFLSKRDAVAKRIERGKNGLAARKSLFDLSDRDLPARLAAVQRALYLLFNEGYHGASPQSVVRAQLCREAVRLAALLLANPPVATPATYALCALMRLSAARLPGRLDHRGDLVALYDQDRSLWDANMIALGKDLLDRAASGSELSTYHVEAAIASVHCSAARVGETDWSRLVWLYDVLLELNPSPVVALNRAIAIGHMNGPERGIEELRAIENADRLESYPFYPAALAEFELRAGRIQRAREHFQGAAALARNAAERRFFTTRLKRLADPADLKCRGVMRRAAAHEAQSADSPVF
jgi:RNA polymerase sigma factor (sigma-70 family)